MFAKCCSNQTNVEPDIVKKLSNMLDKYNINALCFRQAQDKLKEEHAHNLKLQFIFDRSIDGKIYNIQKDFEIVAMIVGDIVIPSYPPRALDRRLQEDWARDAGEGPRVLMSLRENFGPMG